MVNGYVKWYDDEYIPNWHDEDGTYRYWVTENLSTVDSKTALETFTLLKKSVKEINMGKVSKDAQEKLQQKISKLEKLGVTAQANALRAELRLRSKIARVQEWGYKVLPYDKVKAFEGTNTSDGFTFKIHIDKLQDYITPNAKTSTIPDFVLDKLEEAQHQKVFDEFRVLWVEKVKDPLLLGVINGYENYFLITEWSDDVNFDQIMKGSKK